MQYKSRFTTRKEAGVHIIFWVVYFYILLFKPWTGELKVGVFDITWFLLFFSTFYIVYLFILPRVFRPFKWWKAIVSLISVLVFFIAFRYFLEQWLTARLFAEQNYFANTPFWFYLYDNLYFGSRPVVLSTVFWLIVYNVRLADFNKHIVEENKNTEIKFLKAQINPHFIFNTLNNIYSMVYFQSPQSLAAIEKLSNIMRFTTYEAQKDKILLADEISYIQSYIELEGLRHEVSNGVLLNSIVTDDTIKIPPFILSPFVENALKHGVFSKEASIMVTLKSTAEMLDFMVENDIAQKQKDKVGGIGMENVQKRLMIYYPDRHDLHIENEGGKFKIHLKVYFEPKT